MTRSENMRRIKSKNTKPELIVRKIIWSMGYRYRLHRKDLPGKPDIVLTRLRKVIFVHGCFWHGHTCKEGSRNPKSNLEYWLPKRQRNIEKDRQSIEMLKIAGWDIFIVWECELKNLDVLKKQLIEFLEN